MVVQYKLDPHMLGVYSTRVGPPRLIGKKNLCWFWCQNIHTNLNICAIIEFYVFFTLDNSDTCPTGCLALAQSYMLRWNHNQPISYRLVHCPLLKLGSLALRSMGLIWLLSFFATLYCSDLQDRNFCTFAIVFEEARTGLTWILIWSSSCWNMSMDKI